MKNSILQFSIFFIFLFFFKYTFAVELKKFKEINFLIEAQNIEKAFQEIKKSQAGNKKLSAEAQILLGRIYLELEKPSKAFNYFEKVTFSSTKYDSYANAGMANAQIMLGNLSNSLKFAEKSLSIDPDLISGKLILAQVFSELSEHKKAEKLFLSSMGASNQSTYAGRIYASSLIRQNKLLKAEEILKQTVIKNKEDAPSLVLFSEIEWLKGNLETAISYRKKAEKEFRSAGNIIKADEMISWLNYRSIPKSNNNKKKETIKIVKNSKFNNTHKNKTKSLPSNLKSPFRKIFEPKKKPDDVFANTKFNFNKEFTTGSGIILNNGNWVLTNKHVIENITYAVVRNGLGEVRKINEVILSDTDDLAILILSNPFPSDYSLSFNDFTKASTGSDITVIGYPISGIFGTFHPTITKGIVSNPLGFGETKGQFQITAKVNLGNSGGPVFNKYGQIVGIATGIIDKEKLFKEEGLIPDSIAFAVSSDRALNFVNLKLKNNDFNKYVYSTEELYKYMRSAVVFIIGQ